jgi:hypothetical protein
VATRMPKERVAILRAREREVVDAVINAAVLCR